MRDTQELGEKEAGLAIEAIRGELLRRGKKAVIAVSDAHGEPIALLRMDGAPLASVDVALRKLLTAARERAATGELGRAFQSLGWQLSNSDPRFTGWAGGLPARHRGAVVGAVAVSGLAQEEDEELALLGLAAMGLEA